MAVRDAPHIALIGGGYTLQRVAERLNPGTFVITSRDDETCAAWRSRGWLAYQLSIEDVEGVKRLIAKYPSLREFVDSVPPLRGVSDPAIGARALATVVGKIVDARVIYLSTTGVFGVRDGSVVNEDTPPAPWNSQGEARWLSEEAYQESGVSLTALRLPAIYGPDRGVLFSLRAGTYRIVDSGDNWTNRIHVDDLALIIERVLARRPLPRVLCVSDDQPTRARDVAEFVCAREGLPVPNSISSAEVLKAGAYTMLSNQRIDNSLMKRVLGISLRYPSFREAFYS